MHPEVIGAEYIWHASGVGLWVLFAVIALVFVELAVMFYKAKLPFWGVVIPIYNGYLILKLARRSGWWILLSLIPFLGILISLNVTYRISKGFGHGVFFTVGMLLLPPIFYGWLAFSSDEYQYSLNATPRATPWAGFDTWDSDGWRS